MDVSAIAGLATEMSQAKLATEVHYAVLRKAMDLQAQGAAQLVQAAVSAMKATNPPNLGNRLDTFA